MNKEVLKYVLRMCYFRILPNSFKKLSKNQIEMSQKNWCVIDKINEHKEKHQKTHQRNSKLHNEDTILLIRKN